MAGAAVAVAIDVIGVVSGVLGIFQFAQDQMPSRTDNPADTSSLRVHLGGGAGTVPNAGGSLGAIKVYNEDQTIIGAGSGDGPIPMGSFQDITITQGYGPGQQPTYVQISGTDDGVCIAYLIQTWPDGTQRGWLGDMGQACGATWGYSNVIVGTNYKPAIGVSFEDHTLRFDLALRIHLVPPRFQSRAVASYIGTKSNVPCEISRDPADIALNRNRLERMYYGPSTVEKHLVSCLPSPKSKAFIITGSSLATKTPLVSQVEKILGSQHHAGTFSNITQHAPVAQLDEATDAVAKDSAVDTLISIGGGSPIDSAKAISYRAHEKGGEFLHHITIPTTLSAAECTFIAGYTDKQGLKIAVGEPQLAPHVIIYDAKFAVDTPQRLLLSTAIRSLDHAVELMYHPTSTEMPAKAMALSAIEALFTYLPKAKNDPKNEEYITRLQLAAFNSLFSVGTGIAKGMGLSHSLGYALGSPYGIPHPA